MPSYLSYKKFVCDAADDEIESWITVRGNHIPIKKGESKEEAVKNFIASKSDKAMAERGNKPESVGNAAQKVVSQVASNREIYKEHQKQENGKKWDKLTSERGNKPTQVGEAAKKAAEIAKEVSTGKDPDGLIQGVTQEYIEMEQERDGLKNEIRMAKERGRKFEEQKLREEMSNLEEKMAKEVKRIESIKKARPMKEKMREVMNNYYTLYGWEKPALEDFAQGLSDDLEKYKGQEKEVLEEYANILNGAVNRMGMWVDTPTLVKREFVKKMQEEYSQQGKTESGSEKESGNKPQSFRGKTRFGNHIGKLFSAIGSTGDVDSVIVHTVEEDKKFKWSDIKEAIKYAESVDDVTGIKALGKDGQKLGWFGVEPANASGDVFDVLYDYTDNEFCDKVFKKLGN